MGRKSNPIVASVYAVGTLVSGGIPCNICGTALDDQGNCANNHKAHEQVQHAERSILSLWDKPAKRGSLRSQIMD